MAYLSHLVQFLDQTLPWEGFDDSSQNGLQIESSAQAVTKVALAVDSGLSVLEKAIGLKCQLLIVHHGLFWGHTSNLNGILGKKVRTLIEGGCSLYASHLPLDAHPSLGNNAQLLRLLGAELDRSFCKCGSRDISFLGKFKSPVSRSDLEQRLKGATTERRFLSLPFGPTTVDSLAVVTGGGSSAMAEAHRCGTRTFITGEPKQSVYHEAKELEMNALFGGHYATETFGVKAVGQELIKKFSVEIEFLDEPTDI